jgi:type I restriction enzyme S subunit
MKTIRNAHAPKLRFAGFTEPWKEERLSKHFSSSRAKGRDGLPTLSVTLDRGLVDRAELDRKMETNLGPDEHLLVRQDDIAYNMMRMWQGAFGRADVEGMVSPAYVVLRPSSASHPAFFEYAFRRNRAIYLFWAYSYGITNDRLRLYADDFLRIPFRAPTFPEQQKIAAFLTAVDGRIEQLSRKKALLEATKKGVMQQLFTQTLRFQDDHGNDFPDWEEAEFKEIAAKSSAKYDPIGSESELKCVELESISQGTGELLELFVSTDQKSIKNRFKKGEVLFGKLRPYLRKWLLAPFDGVCSSEIWVLRGRKVTNAFLYHLVQSDQFMREANVSSGSKMPLRLPSLPEQTKIAGFLSALDGKIAAVGEPMRQTQAWKKGLLQRMFV